MTAPLGRCSALGRDLERIGGALAVAAAVVQARVGCRATTKGGDLVTEADLAVDAVLRQSLLRPGEGWLSEETPDSPARLGCRRVWVVDPLDGTNEFVEGLPEFAVSVGLVEDGEPVLGGVCNPATGETVLGGVGLGVRLNGQPVGVRATSRLENAEILASRSEVKRGEWDRYHGASFRLRPMGSVAWKLALVAAGRADATWTLCPKHEWDVAGGVALVKAGGGTVRLLDGEAPVFNRPQALFPGLFAGHPALLADVVKRWSYMGQLGGKGSFEEPAFWDPP